MDQAMMRAATIVAKPAVHKSLALILSDSAPAHGVSSMATTDIGAVSRPAVCALTPATVCSQYMTGMNIAATANPMATMAEVPRTKLRSR